MWLHIIALSSGITGLLISSDIQVASIGSRIHLISLAAILGVGWVFANFSAIFIDWMLGPRSW